MSIKDRLQAVKRAELDCQAQSGNVRAARQSLAANFSEAATPWRIVGIGTLAGFLLGRSRVLAAASGVGSKLFLPIAQALITALGAHVAAGAAAQSELDEGAADEAETPAGEAGGGVSGSDPA